jgi:hypothetical protein
VGRYHHRPCADDKDEAAEVPENHVARLLGHDLKTMSFGVYSGGVPYEVLQRAVECLDWQ